MIAKRDTSPQHRLSRFVETGEGLEVIRAQSTDTRKRDDDEPHELEEPMTHESFMKARRQLMALTGQTDTHEDAPGRDDPHSDPRYDLNEDADLTGIDMTDQGDTEDQQDESDPMDEEEDTTKAGAGALSYPSWMTQSQKRALASDDPALIEAELDRLFAKDDQEPDPEDQLDQGADEQDEGDATDDPRSLREMLANPGSRDGSDGGLPIDDPTTLGRLQHLFGRYKNRKLGKRLALDLIDNARKPRADVENMAADLRDRNPKLSPVMSRMMAMGRIAAKEGDYGKALVKATGLASTYGPGGQARYRPDGDGTNETPDDPGYGHGLASTSGSKSGLSTEYNRRRIDDLVRMYRSRDRMLTATAALRRVRANYPNLFA